MSLLHSAMENNSSAMVSMETALNYGFECPEVN